MFTSALQMLVKMNSFLVFVVCLALFSKTNSFVSSNDEAASIENRLDQIQSAMNLMFVDASEKMEALAVEIRALKDNNELLLRNVTVLTNRSDEIIANQQYCANHEALKNLFFELTPKCGSGAFNSTPKPPEVTYNSCREAPYRSGVYQLMSNVSNRPYKVYCEVNEFGKGWTVFQKRLDGSVNFNRSWIEYKNGFGDVSSEYWLGLETLHQLTTQKPHELMIVFTRLNGSTSYARYAGIIIDSEAQKYKLHLNYSGTGTATDSLYPYRGEVFVTPDVPSGSHLDCAKYLASGFWHYTCGSVKNRNNLNGIYGQTARRNGIWWYESYSGYQQYYPLIGVQMLIREKGL